MVIAPPDGDLLHPTIAPVEALIQITEDHVPAYSVRMLFEDGDLERLQRGGRIWVTFMGHMVPFNLQTTDPLPGEAT